MKEEFGATAVGDGDDSPDGFIDEVTRSLQLELDNHLSMAHGDQEAENEGRKECVHGKVGGNRKSSSLPLWKEKDRRKTEIKWWPYLIFLKASSFPLARSSPSAE